MAKTSFKENPHILVEAPPGATKGLLHFHGQSYICALGRSGLVADKHEGDGATPTGTFALRKLHYRADRIAAPPSCALTGHALHLDDGWCDAPDDPAYNQPVTHPHPASHEQLWRSDHLYDILVTLGYNDDPVVAGKGSAIFFHLANQKNGALEPTEGCVALVLADMLDVLKKITPQTQMEIRSTG